MKILFLVTELFSGTGGIRQFNNNFVNALFESGHKIHIISMNDNHNVTGSPDFNSKKFTFTLNFKWFGKMHFIKNVFFKNLSFKPDIIVCGHVNFSPVCMVLSKIFNVPYITITHGIDVWNLNGLKFVGLENSTKIISVSRYTKNKIFEQFKKISKDRIFMLPNTFDSNRFKIGLKPKYLMARYKIKETDKVILTIARLSKSEKYKGYDNVILAVKELTKKIPNIKYIIGGSGQDINRIKNLIKCSGLEDKVLLTGFIPDVNLVDYYNLCDVFAMPSKGEGFGIVFLEALACGKPVIAGNKDGSVDAVLDGEIGTLIDPDDIEGIKNAIISIFNSDVDKRIIDGEYLRKKVIEEFSFDKFNERVKKIMERVLCPKCGI